MGNGNFKAICLDAGIRADWFTSGKVYEIKDGLLTYDNGNKADRVYNNISDLNTYYTAVFDYVEDPITITDILHKCAKLQTQGLNVAFTSHNGRIEVEHRNNEDFALIVRFTTHDVQDANVLNVIGKYLDELLKNVVEDK